MLKNYFKVAIRNLLRHKGYSFINVLGLSVGIACCILIGLFVQSEWSYDRFHSKSERLYRAWLQEHYQGEIFNSIATPIPLATVLQSGIPEIEAVCRTSDLGSFINYNHNKLNATVTLVDTNFFKLFDFKLLQGNINNPFPTSQSILLTEDESKRIFGNYNPLGQVIHLSLRDSIILFTVTGIVANPPIESSIKFNMLIPISNGNYIWSEKARTSGWSNVMVQTFVLMKPQYELSSVHQKIDATMQPLVSENYKPGQYLVRMQSLKDIYFNTTLPEEVESASDPKYSYILATISLLVLLIACINFVTLSVGRSVTRALEVGVRKVLGAERKQIITQFWGEAVFITLVSVITGILISIILLNSFNQLANREFIISVNSISVVFIFLLILIIAFIAGLYPSLVLSRFRPIQVLKGGLRIADMGMFGKTLVVGQFVASIILIIATITIGLQLDYLKSKNLGFNREHVIIVPTNLDISEGRAFGRTFQNELAKIPDVISTTTSIYALHNYGWMSFGFTDENKVFRQFKFNAVDADFIPTMQLEVVEGRNFESGNPADSNYVLVNEAFVKEYGLIEPIGQKLPGKYEQTIIGVLKDFNFETLYTPVKPAVLTVKPTNIFQNSSDVSYEQAPRPRVSVRFKAGDPQQHLEQLRAAWKIVAGDREFESAFLDESLAAAYQQEQRLGKIVQYSSFLSIFIACMGLFGLATLVVVRRTKEIGIRKIMGADVKRIVTLLTKDFILLVIIASFIAFPIAWWALNNWLQDFTYRINIPWWVFMLSAGVAFTVAIGTVSIQTIKAALSNPVKNLRTE